MKYIALTLPGMSQPIAAPSGVPTGGLASTGKSIFASGLAILFLIAILMALAYLMMGGFKWMTSGGEQEKLGAARQTIIYAIIGIGIVALSFTAVNLIDVFFHPAQCLLCLFN